MTFIKNITILFLIQFCFSISMWDVYFDASPDNGYDKYIILNPEEVYTGGFGVYEGTVFIEGNGAVIDLQEGLGIWVSAENTESNVQLNMEYICITKIKSRYNH